MKTAYQVSGMTCGHCVNHVKEEVSAIDGVQAVEVEQAGSMTITSEQEIDFDVVAQAVAEAGDYQVVKAR